MNLAAIRDALADKINAYISPERPNVNVRGYEGMAPLPVIEVAPDDPYVIHWREDGELTFGANGISQINLRVQIYVPATAGVRDMAQRVVDDLLSIGTSNPGSVFDAVMEAPRTLGGLIEDMRASHATTTPPSDNGVSATVFVQIYARKGGAQV